MEIKELNIRHFKLINGEDIIALCSVKNDDSYIIERPLVVSSNLIGGFQFIPWFPFSENKAFKVLKNRIVSHVQVAEDVKEAYVDFALKLNERRRPVPSAKSDSQIMKELEETLLDRYDEERSTFAEEDDKEYTIH